MATNPKSNSRPAGLLGVAAAWGAGVGVKVNVGIKGPSGAPIHKDRFFLMSPHAHSADTSGPNKLRRDFLPAFAAWNERSMPAQGRGQVAPGLPPTVTLRGLIAHSRLQDCVRWNRAAQKAANGEKSPPSGRPWCQGNGVEAVRIATDAAGEEAERSIPCPNEECPFAINGLCKPRLELLFMLRWDGGAAWQAGLPPLLALYTSHSWNTLKSLLGLFTLVLGTEAVTPWEPEETWIPGIAAELGVTEPSLFGLPFAMTVGEKTKPARPGQEGRRFPVVTFAPEGDLAAWLLSQLQRRRYLESGNLLAPKLLPSVLDEDLQPALDVAHVELEPAIDTGELPGLQLADAPVGPAPSHEERPKPEPPPPPAPDPALMVGRDLTRLRLETQRMGLPVTEVEEVFGAIYGRCTAIPKAGEERILEELRKRAAAATALPHDKERGVR